MLSGTDIKMIWEGGVVQTGLGITSRDGMRIENATAAALNAQQMSPRNRFAGYGWETGGGTSQRVEWIEELLPVQAAAASSHLIWSSQENGAGYTRRFSFASTGQFFVGNENANGGQTIGITINQGANDDQALALKSSDVATVLTTITGTTTETDDYFTLQKHAATTGGALLQALGENAAVTTNLRLESYGGQASTTKSTAGRSLVEVYASQHDGANALANIAADGNVFGVRARVGAADVTVAIVDEDGDLWLNGGITAVAVTMTGALAVTVAALTATFTNSNDGASSQVAIFQGDRATPADNDAAYITFRLSDSAGNQDEGARITWQATTVADGATQDTDLILSAVTNGSLLTYLTLDGSAQSLNSSQNVFVIDTMGVVIGGTTQQTIDTLVTELQVTGTAAADSSGAFIRGSADGSGPALIFGKGRDALGTYTTVLLVGDEIGRIGFFGANGTDLSVQSAAITGNAATGFASNTDVPGYLAFWTTSDGASTVTHRLRINSEGVIIIGNNELTTTAVTGNTLRAGNATTGGAGNIAGADLTIAAGLGTGTGDAGQIIFSLPIVAAAGDNIQTTATRLTLDMAASSTVLTMESAQALTISLPTATLTITGADLVDVAAGIFELNNAARWDTGVAVVATAYSIGRDDSTVLHFNVPTGATFEWSVNDVAEMTLSATTLALGTNNVTIDGTITFGVASDIIFAAATAAALELSDGTTKFYALDTRVATASVTTHALDISDYTIASGATNVETGWSLAAHTLNYTGATQVTTQVDTMVVGARTIAGDTATLTVDEANTLLLVAPLEGLNVAITAASALRIVNAGGTPVNQYGIYIEDLTVGATADIGIYIAGADTYAIHVASADPVRLGLATGGTGVLQFVGTTSGVVTVTVAAAAGTWTMTLPTGVAGTAGFQLTDAGGDGVTSWSGAGSREAYKDIHNPTDRTAALNRILAAQIFDFHFRKGQPGTGDYDTLYHGVTAEKNPEYMHYEGGVLNPISTFGDTALAIQALYAQIAILKAKLAKN